MDFLLFLLTLLCAAAGGLALYRLHIPSGAMLGALLAVALLNTLTGEAHFYDGLKIVLQILSGAMIGGKISRDDLHSMKTLLKPAAILVGSMIVLNLTFGAVIHFSSGLDVPTALFATTPGGVADMALIAEDLNADTGIVAILQLFRCLIVFCCFPPIFKKMIGRLHGRQTDSSAVAAPRQTKTGWREFCGLLLFAAVAGVLCWLLGITAGALIGGMVGGAAFSLWKNPVLFAKPLRVGLQIFAGAFIGIKMGRDALALLPKLWLPVLIMLVGIFIFVFAITWLLHRFTGLPYDVCLLSSTPAGVQEMALLSEELGVDTVKVSVLQTTRLVFVILLFPSMIHLVTALFG